MDTNIICFVLTGRKKDFLLFPFLLLFQWITWEILTIKLEKQLITRKDVGVIANILQNPKMYHVENMVLFQYIYALVKHRSRKMMCWHYCITLQFERHHLDSLSTFQTIARISTDTSQLLFLRDLIVYLTASWIEAEDATLHKSWGTKGMINNRL